MTADKPTLSLTGEGAAAGSSRAASGATSPDQQELQEQIAQTRQELADTVSALAAKADLRTRTRDRAGQVKDVTGAQAARVTEQAARVTEQAVRQAGQIRGGARAVAVRAREAVAAQTPAGRRSVAGVAAALTAAVIAVSGTWLMRRGRHRQSRQWGRR